MSLSGVLSAVRQLILDEAKLPATLKERELFIGANYLNLTPEEVQDLASIEPSKIAVYTGTIFAGERSTLKSHFPLTFALLARGYKKSRGGAIDSLALVKELHRSRPWKGSATAALAANFVEFLRYDRPDLIECAPECVDCARLEELSLQILRAPNDSLSARDTMSLSQLGEVTVSELLVREVFIPSATRLEKFSTDVLELRRAYYANDRELGDITVHARTVFAAGGRTKELTARWVEIPAGLFTVLSQTDLTDWLPLEDLAVGATEDLPTEMPDTEKFEFFLKTLTALLDAGVIVLPHAA